MVREVKQQWGQKASSCLFLWGNNHQRVQYRNPRVIFTTFFTTNTSSSGLSAGRAQAPTPQRIPNPTGEDSGHLFCFFMDINKMWGPFKFHKQMFHSDIDNMANGPTEECAGRTLSSEIKVNNLYKTQRKTVKKLQWEHGPNRKRRCNFTNCWNNKRVCFSGWDGREKRQRVRREETYVEKVGHGQKNTHTPLSHRHTVRGKSRKKLRWVDCSKIVLIGVASLCI